MAYADKYKIPERQQVQAAGHNPQAKAVEPVNLNDGIFCEIEYDSRSASDAGNLVPRPQRLQANPMEKDEIRNRFTQMRDIARSQRSTYDYFRFFDRRIQHNNAVIFYKQGMFMKDFTDDYTGSVPFSQYFPYYQMMGYEQLRTYFTWRTNVRKGNVTDTSLSYAFLYIYELLGNIGVNDPQDGLDKLVYFWKAFSVYNKSIDKYVLKWLKDYHIYYELPHSFKAIAEQHGIAAHYPKSAGPDDSFDLFCAISRYDIRKSAFFAQELQPAARELFGDKSKMIADCFSFVLDRIKRDFEAAGMLFDNVFFRPTRRIVRWSPFNDALFHPWLKQRDRRVVLSENEIYVCKRVPAGDDGSFNNEWTFSAVVTSEKGKQFIGFVMKQMEVVLRKATKYKYKLTANIDMVNEDTIRKLTKSGLFTEKIVTAAVEEFYREATKTVVTLNHTSLDRIRQEALITQEALIVEEQAGKDDEAPDNSIFTDSTDIDVKPSDEWESLGEALNENELRALAAILQDGDIKAVANVCGIMPEVLVDGINEKAMDYIGDNLMDEDFVLYDEYIDQVKELIR